LLLIRAGYAPYMSIQSFPHKPILYLWIETQLSPLLLIRAGNAAYLALQTFPVRPQYKDLVWFLSIWNAWPTPKKNSEKNSAAPIVSNEEFLCMIHLRMVAYVGHVLTRLNSNQHAS
jgi:hypothetical protein